ncbi:hypothetical protein [Rhizobium bangladeshense]|nr:hypothetical protein [Rhizobium bangladeshense]
MNAIDNNKIQAEEISLGLLLYCAAMPFAAAGKPQAARPLARRGE